MVIVFLAGACVCDEGYTSSGDPDVCLQLDSCGEIGTCQNGGSCVEGNCQCPTGFTGANCESESIVIHT